jgi:hypothetical protein
MLKEDPIVEEIRKIRKMHAAKFNNDLKAICADLKEKEKECGHPVVSLLPKCLLNATGS